MLELKPVSCEDGKEESQRFQMIEQGVQRPWEELKSATVAEEQTTGRPCQKQSGRKVSTMICETPHYMFKVPART